METSGTNSDQYRNSSISSRRYGMQFSAANLIQAPLSALLEYSGILRTTRHQENETLINGGMGFRDHAQSSLDDSGDGNDGGVVSIRIIGAGEQENVRTGPPSPVGRRRNGDSGENGNGAPVEQTAGVVMGSNRDEDRRNGNGNGNGNVNVNGNGNANGNGGGASSPPLISQADFLNSGLTGEVGSGVVGNFMDSSYQRYDIQQVARWIEQILPFSLLLLVVFIRQHLQGFFVTIWIAAVMFKSNDILRKQTALKGERKISVLVGITFVFVLHVVGVYWWCRNDDLLYPLVMLPPKAIPPFWHAIFIVLVNDTMVRQAAMVLKCILLMYYKNSRGRNYRKQGQMLTLVEYLLLLYRASLPTPVWYRFFLNKEYGSLFSSLTTGLYLTFKLTSVVEKVQSFFAALKALSRKEVHYGSYATIEQVIATGDLCAICQEKMHAPIFLRCKHIFCEDCVSEWFERERTCPLCRMLVKQADLRSFGDGSTSLFFQLF
ncbi:uncharacterized protein LOC143856124 isoform X2 [Tasmannia lanceolata]|uniref:uncharacterized protein LOC143856124 isoform X2 n=1 Tax=Tasmannia lanceolata TaxID=3420 RepID=UPI0040627E6B